MSRPALFLIALSLLTFFLGLGRPAIADADEAFYAESAREMIELGDWLTPHFNYEHRWQKPVLYYWLTAATYSLFGVSEWTARAWSALCGLGLVLAIAAAGRRLTSHADVGWLAGAIAATSFGYFALARMALPDLPLAFFVTVAVMWALEYRWALAGAAGGLGFLMKGPVAVILPLLVLAPIWWRGRHARAIRPRAVATAAAAFLALGLPWYVAMTMTHGAAYLDSFFVGDNLERFATDRFNEPRSVFFYVPVLVGGLFPWSAYLVVAAWRPARDLLARRLNLGETGWQLLIWAAVPLLFFSISIGKQPRYILPILPPVAILMARAILWRVDAAARGDRGARRELRAATLTTAIVVAALAAAMANARSLFVTVPPALTWGASAALLACAGVLAGTAHPARLWRLPVVVPVCAAVMLVAVQFGALAGRRPEPVEIMAAHVRDRRTNDEAIGVYHVFVRNLPFYTGLPRHELFGENQAADFMRSGNRVLLLVHAQDLPRLEALAGVRMARLAEVPYVNMANLKLRQALAPDPARDVQRVLLVANR